MTKTLGFISDWIWQLPQTLVGYIYKSILRERAELIEDGDTKVYQKPTSGGVSLGRYVFVYKYSLRKELVTKHEKGHRKQSKILGWLYLPVIGIPSIIWAGIHKKVAPNTSYYSFYTEKWANKIMGIEKEMKNIA